MNSYGPKVLLVCERVEMESMNKIIYLGIHFTFFSSHGVLSIVYSKPFIFAASLIHQLQSNKNLHTSSYIIVNNIHNQFTNSLAGTATVENETFHRSLLAARLANDANKNGKKAGENAPPVNIGWDSHRPVVSETFCRCC